MQCQARCKNLQPVNKMYLGLIRKRPELAAKVVCAGWSNPKSDYMACGRERQEGQELTAVGCACRLELADEDDSSDEGGWGEDDAAPTLKELPKLPQVEEAERAPWQRSGCPLALSAPPVCARRQLQSTPHVTLPMSALQRRLSVQQLMCGRSTSFVLEEFAPLVCNDGSFVFSTKVAS